MREIDPFLISCHIIVITIVECDTRKYHEFIAECCYECEAWVTIPKAMNEWRFPGITFCYGNNEFIIWQTCGMIGSYIATPPGNKKSISNVAMTVHDRMNEQEVNHWVE